VTSAVAKARVKFHANLQVKLLTMSDDGIPSNADRASSASKAVATEIVKQLGSYSTAQKLAGQTAGASFEAICLEFIQSTFLQLSHLRPGIFQVEKGGRISLFDQYEHLDALDQISKANKAIATAIGSDYLIKPDIVVWREPETDDVLNAKVNLVDSSVANLTSLRKTNQLLPILHASISCKWTIRSDRAQNARSEGLNLVRNRKGRLPHIAVLTGEPLPTRIASLALGTGDIDCVYHFALPELVCALKRLDRETDLELLNTMIEGKRIRDISDLPLDLVI
jgi:hypothetical protein